METRDGEERQEVEELKEEKIRETLKMNNKKAVGVDGILMEAWKYAEDTI